MSFLPDSFKAMRLCRGCMSTEIDNLHPLFIDNKEQLFEDLTSIKISSNDGLPKLLCGNCTRKLSEHNAFRMLCISSNVILKKRLDLIAREKSFVSELSSSSPPPSSSSSTPKPKKIKLLPSTNDDPEFVKKFISTDAGYHDDIEFKPAVMKMIPSKDEHKINLNGTDETKIDVKIENGIYIPKKIDNPRQSLLVDFDHLTEEWQPCILLRKISKDIPQETQNCIKYPFICHICYGCFERKYEYDSHLLAHENQSNFMNLNIKKEQEIEINSKNVSLPSMPINTKNISILNNLNETAKSIVNIDDITQNENDLHAPFPKNNETIPRKKYKSKSVRKMFSCDICSAIIPKYRNLIPHMSSHINTSPIKLSCDICMKKFATNNDLELHIVTNHGDIVNDKKLNENDSNDATAAEKNVEQMHKCDICSKTFAWDHQLQYHKNVHRDAKQLTCDVCSKKLPNIMTYRRHLQLHNIALHQCTVCLTAKFQTIKELREHRGKCGKSVNGKTISCGNCGRVFRSIGGLNVHKSTKTCQKNGKYQYFCIRCGRKFLTKNGLNVHNVQSHK